MSVPEVPRAEQRWTIYIAEGEPVRQPGEKEAERFGFKNVEVVRASVFDELRADYELSVRQETKAFMRAQAAEAAADRLAEALRDIEGVAPGGYWGDRVQEIAREALAWNYTGLEPE